MMASNFPIGSLVALKTCSGVGVVIDHQRGRVLVAWAGLEFTGRHRPESLKLATESSS